MDGSGAIGGSQRRRQAWRSSPMLPLLRVRRIGSIPWMACSASDAQTIPEWDKAMDSQEHDLSLVRQHRVPCCAVLCRDFPGQRSRCGASGACGPFLGQARRCLDRSVHRHRHPAPGPERWPGTQVPRGVLTPGGDGRSSRHRPPVELLRGKRRAGRRLRQVQGQVELVAADHAARPQCGGRRPGSRRGAARIRGDDEVGQDRHRGNRIGLGAVEMPESGCDECGALLGRPRRSRLATACASSGACPTALRASHRCRNWASHGAIGQ